MLQSMRKRGTSVKEPTQLEKDMLSIQRRIYKQIREGETTVSPRRQSYRPEPQKSSKSRFFKSEFTNQDRQRMRSLKQGLERFERELEWRSQRVESESKQKLVEERQRSEQKQKDEVQRQRNSSRIKRELSRLRQRARQEESQVHESRSKSGSRKWLFMEMQKQYQEREKSQQNERQDLLSVLQAQRRQLVQINKLKDHEKTYMKQLKQQRAERATKVEELKQAMKYFESNERRNRPTSKFYHQVGQIIHEEKQQSQVKNDQKVINQVKLKNFIDKMRSESQPIRRPKKISQPEPETTNRRTALPKDQFKRRGDLFLRESLKIARSKAKTEVVEVAPTSPTATTKDYIKQMRHKREHTGSVGLLGRTETKIDRILSQPQNSEDKVAELRKLAYSLEGQRESWNEFLDVQKIQARFKVFEAALATAKT